MATFSNLDKCVAEDHFAVDFVMLVEWVFAILNCICVFELAFV
jgi:hypothetical protein